MDAQPDAPGFERRIEALTTNLEIMSGMLKDLLESQKRTDAAVERLSAIVGPIAQLVLDHERRLNRLEE